MTSELKLGSDLVDEARRRKAQEVMDRMAAPFGPDVVKWKAQTAKGNRAMAVAYIDGRDIADRLDQAVGWENWRDEYQVLPDGCVMCLLSVRFGGEWVTKSDVGGQSDQPDEGDKMKAAYSDAFKRAAVKFGVGRYLYRLPKQWVDYDPQKRQLARQPTLPAWALPAGHKAKPAAQAPPQPAPDDDYQTELAQAPPKAPPKKNGGEAPQSVTEVLERLKAKDAAMAAAGQIKAGTLLAAFNDAAKEAGLLGPAERWPVDKATAVAVATVKLLTVPAAAG